MKKLLAILLSLVLCAGLLAACSKEQAPATPDTTDAPGGSAAPTVTGETYDVGNFTVLVPEGWMASPILDMWSDSGDMDPDQINLVKGGTSDFDVYTKPSVQVVHYDPGSMLTPSKDFYEGAEDVEPITTGSLTWEGFRTTDLLGNAMTILWTTAGDGHQYQINAFYQTEQGSYALTDADVQAIFASISAKS